MNNTIFDASGIHGIIIEPSISFELLEGLQFLLLNSKDKMYYHEQKERWEQMRQLAIDLSHSANYPIIDTLKVRQF